MKNHNIIRFLLYDADLGNNTKLFRISVYCEELLIIKFCFQGNKKNWIHLIFYSIELIMIFFPHKPVLLIIYLFLIFLLQWFHTLNYTCENAKINLNE